MTAANSNAAEAPLVAQPSGKDRPEPTVLISPGAEHELEQIALSCLREASDWYKRGGQIVTASKDDNGRPTIAPVSAARFYTRLCGLARWQKLVYDKKEKEWVPSEAPAPKDVAAAAFSAGDWPSLRPLVGIRDTPILRHDGTLWQIPGYDPESKCIYAPTIRFPRIKERPTQGDANEALARVADLFCNMVYEQPAQRYVVISAMMSILGRDAIESAVPAHLFGAPQKGTGKGLQLEVISQVSLGHHMIPFHLPMPVDGDRFETSAEEEQEKRLSGAAFDASRALFIDNVRNGSIFGGPIVDRYLTAAKEVKVRLLGSNRENPVLPWRIVMILSGNHVHVQNDTRRRTIEARLVPTCANPHLRDQSMFKYPLAKGFALAHRGAIAADLYTIMVAHARAGRPREKRPDVANFESWQSVVADAIVWAGGLDPSSCLLTEEEGLTGEDGLVAAFMRVLQRIGAHAGGELDKPGQSGASTSDIIDAVWTSAWLDSTKPQGAPLVGEPQPVTDAREAFTAAWRLSTSKRPAAKSIGARLGDLCGRVLSGEDVWPADDASGFQRGEWRITTSIDRNKSPRYLLSAPSGR